MAPGQALVPPVAQVPVTPPRARAVPQVTLDPPAPRWFPPGPGL